MASEYDGDRIRDEGDKTNYARLCATEQAAEKHGQRATERRNGGSALGASSNDVSTPGMRFSVRSIVGCKTSPTIGAIEAVDLERELGIASSIEGSRETRGAMVRID